MSSPLSFPNIKETCLYIQDLDKAEAFYHGLLGLPVISRVDGRHIFFRVGTSVLLCFIADVTKNEKRLPSHFAEGKQHIAFGTTLSEYDQWKKRIEELNIPITCEYEWRPGLFSFYFEDLEGHVLEIVPNEVWD